MPPLQNGVVVLDEVDVEVDGRVEGRGEVGHVREGRNPRGPDDLVRADLENDSEFCIFTDI